MKIINRSLRKRVLEWIESHRFIIPLMQELKEDLFKNKETTLKQKLWAYSRGFRSSKIIMYGLTEENYTEYLSDFDYHRLQPINGRFRKWIDDKLTMKYILHRFDAYLPKYYYQLEHNKAGAKVTRLMDCPDQYTAEVADIVQLLKVEGCLAAKLIEGSLGVGFYKLSFLENQYYINDRLINENEIINFLQTLDGYILTEYVTAHQDIAKICNDKGSSFRILTVQEEGEKPQIVGSFIRFSTKKSGSVDNVSAGGVAALVNIDTGYFHNGRMLIKDEWAECKLHPNTQAAMEGILPFWDKIAATVLDICNYLPQIRLMGFDIIVTNNGFKIIEINSQPAIALHNYYDPIYTNDISKEFFRKLVNEKNT